MYTKEEFNEFYKMELENIDPNELKELTEIKIDSDLPVGERLQNFLEQIHNPYIFCVNGVKVQLRFNPLDSTLNEHLAQYFIQKRLSDNTLRDK